MNRYEALKHAVKAHAGQVDKCGQPYILHPIAVAEVFDTSATYLFSVGPETVEDARVVALLHDVWENTSYSLDDAGLTPVQTRQLLLLTRQSQQTYAGYIEAICEEPIAAIVKLADLAHNLSPERQACLPESERKGLEKRYLKARSRIWEALGYEWWPEQIGDQGEAG